MLLKQWSKKGDNTTETKRNTYQCLQWGLVQQMIQTWAHKRQQQPQKYDEKLELSLEQEAVHKENLH